MSVARSEQYGPASRTILNAVRAGRAGKGQVSPLKVWSPYELASPTREIYGDRFIPLSADRRHLANLGSDHELASPPLKRRRVSTESLNRSPAKSPYQVVLREQLLESSPERRSKRTLFAKSALFQYKSSNRIVGAENLDPNGASYSVSFVDHSSPTRDLLSPVIKPNLPKIPSTSLRVLDAPHLEGDFYLNLLDWSSKNVVALALDYSIYLWKEGNSELFCKCQSGCKPTSVGFNRDGNLLGVGLSNGLVRIYDSATKQHIHQFQDHKRRVSVLTWKRNCLLSGSRSGNIEMHDVRMKCVAPVRTFAEHKQEVCGLKCYYDGDYLASGCNDNKVMVWDMGSGRPVHTFQHKAAVKALDWNPHRPGVLTSGGGTSDKTVCSWNVMTGQQISTVNVGSQVTGLLWSQHSNYLVTTHGYNTNRIVVWDGQTMEKYASLEGHTSRVLYAALSPDSTTLVTAADFPDQTVRFWTVFPKLNSSQRVSSCLTLFDRI